MPWIHALCRITWEAQPRIKQPVNLKHVAIPTIKFVLLRLSTLKQKG